MGSCAHVRGPATHPLSASKWNHCAIQSKPKRCAPSPFKTRARTGRVPSTPYARPRGRFGPAVYPAPLGLTFSSPAQRAQQPGAVRGRPAERWAERPRMEWGSVVAVAVLTRSP